MNIKIIDKNGVTLKTKGKYCKEDISVSVDVPTGGGGGESTLKKLLDYTKSTSYMFYKNTTIKDLTGYIDYNDTENVTNMSYMVSECSELLNVPSLNTKNVTNMSYFANICKKLKTIGQLDLSNVTNIAYAFKGCEKLQTVELLNTGNLNSMSCAFQNCEVLTNITPLDTTKVTNFNQTFTNCYRLLKIDITYYNIPSENYSKYFCFGCRSLKALIIRGFGGNYTLNSNGLNDCYHLTGTVDTTYNPTGAKDGYIYVPRSMVDTLKSATNWSAYADQIRALEDYTVDGTTTGELDESKI